MAATPALYRKIGYKPLEDFEFLGMVNEVPMTLIGLQEAATTQTQAQNTAENTSLSLIRSTLISADPYETATALQETEASIQNLYTLTARLSRLKLTDYL